MVDVKESYYLNANRYRYSGLYVRAQRGLLVNTKSLSAEFFRCSLSLESEALQIAGCLRNLQLGVLASVIAVSQRERRGVY